MDPITIALGLAQFAPTLLRYFGVGEKNVSVAEKAIETAKLITNAASPEEAVESLKADPALVLRFKEAILAQESRFEELYYADRADARKRDTAFVSAGTRNYRADALSALAVIVVVVITYGIWHSEGLDDFAKSAITLILGRFLGYLDNIFQFEFGSTRNNRTKDDTIAAMVKTAGEK